MRTTLAASVIYQVRLIPIDPILFRDYRTARAGGDHDSQAREPSPHTIFGAIGANVAAKYNVPIDENEATWKPVEPVLGKFCSALDKGAADRSELVGYTYCDIEGQPWFPWPRHLAFIENEGTIRTGQLPELREWAEVAISHTDNEFRNLLDYRLHPAEDDPVGYVSETLLAGILSGDGQFQNKILKGKTEARRENYLPETFLYQPETRAGLRMEYASNTAETSMLFMRPYRRFHAGVTLEHRWGASGFLTFYKTMTEIKDTQAAPVAFLGGDRGRAVISFSKISPKIPFESMMTKVKQSVKSGSKGFAAYLLTPAVREDQWPVVDGHKPIAGAIGREQIFSGWNMNRNRQHPREIRHLIPAGSVFFYEWNPNDDRGNFIESNWLEPIDNNFRNSGFGRMLLGVWS